MDIALWTGAMSEWNRDGMLKMEYSRDEKGQCSVLALHVRVTCMV